MKAYAKAGAGRLLDLGLLPLALVVLFVGLALTEPRFLGPQNLINVLRGGALLMIVACGQMLVLIVRGMDLSVGSTMALTSVVSALVMAHLAPGSGPGVAITAGIAAGLAVGVVVGLCNGIAVAVFGITPFMVTLAMASIVGGVALSLTNGIPIYGLPEAFVAGLGRTLWLGGTELSRTRESSMFNCSYTHVETVYDIVDVLWLLLQGSHNAASRIGLAQCHIEIG